MLPLCLLLLACKGTPSAPHAAPARALAVEGVTVQVPNDLVTLEADRTQRLRDSYTRQEPDTDVSIAAVRGATLSDATVYVINGVSRRDLPANLRTVQDGLNAGSDEMLEVLSQGGAQAKDLQSTSRDGRLETCVTAVFREVSLPPVRLCALFYLGADARLRTLSTTCMARDATLCDRVLASRSYTVTGALAPAATLKH